MIKIKEEINKQINFQKKLHFVHLIKKIINKEQINKHKRKLFNHKILASLILFVIIFIHLLLNLKNINGKGCKFTNNHCNK
jgi:hypothetical protein